MFSRHDRFLFLAYLHSYKNFISDQEFHFGKELTYNLFSFHFFTNGKNTSSTIFTLWYEYDYFHATIAKEHSGAHEIIAHATQLAKGNFIGCSCNKFTVPSSMSQAFSRGIYTTLSVIDAGDASLRRIWNLIGFRNVCARIARFSWIFHPSTEKKRKGWKRKGKEHTWRRKSLPPLSSFPQKRKKKTRKLHFKQRNRMRVSRVALPLSKEARRSCTTSRSSSR